MIVGSKSSPVLKRRVKSALLEVLDERPELLREALEDLGLGRAIRDGLKSSPISRAEVFAQLRRKRP